MIFVCLVAVVRLHKLMTRHALHGTQNGFIPNAARPQLALNHVVTFERKSVGFEVGNQAHFTMLPVTLAPMTGLARRGSGQDSLLSLANSDVEANHAVLVAYRHDRDIAGQVVLDLDDLL